MHVCKNRRHFIASTPPTPVRFNSLCESSRRCRLAAHGVRCCRVRLSRGHLQLREAWLCCKALRRSIMVSRHRQDCHGPSLLLLLLLLLRSSRRSVLEPAPTRLNVTRSAALDGPSSGLQRLRALKIFVLEVDDVASCTLACMQNAFMPASSNEFKPAL